MAPRLRCKQERSVLQDLLDPNGIEAWESFTCDDPTDKENPAKIFSEFENRSQTPNMQWNYREEAYNLKQQEDETLEQLNTGLINVATHETKWTPEKW